MRDIKYIVIHCTATSSNATIEAIKQYWKEEKGWKNPGYHYIIKTEGDIVPLLDEKRVANGVRGYNRNGIHLSYIGGKDGKDTRTLQQKTSIQTLVKRLRERYPNAVVQGHRDFPNVKKSCPNFDVKKEFPIIIKTT